MDYEIGKSLINGEETSITADIAVVLNGVVASIDFENSRQINKENADMYEKAKEDIINSLGIFICTIPAVCTNERMISMVNEHMRFVCNKALSIKTNY